MHTTALTIIGLAIQAMAHRCTPPLCCRWGVVHVLSCVAELPQKLLLDAHAHHSHSTTLLQRRLRACIIPVLGSSWGTTILQQTAREQVLITFISLPNEDLTCHFMDSRSQEETVSCKSRGVWTCHHTFAAAPTLDALRPRVSSRHRTSSPHAFLTRLNRPCWTESSAARGVMTRCTMRSTSIRRVV